MPTHRSAILFCLLLLSFTCAIGQSWRASYQQAQGQYEKNELESALMAGKQALQAYISENGETNDNYAAILRLLANILYSQGEYEQGLEYAGKEIQLRESKKDALLATALSNAALFHQQLGAYNKALNQLSEAYSILKDFYRPEEDEVLVCQLSLATNFYLSDNPARAIGFFESAFQHIKPETTAADLTEAYYYFGMALMESGQWHKALKAFDEAQRIYIAASTTTSESYALLLSAMAQAFHASGDYARAEEYYQKSEDLFVTLKQTSNEEYFHVLNGRAVNFQTQNKTAEAQKILDQLAQHPEGKSAYAVALNNSAALQQKKGQFEEAEKSYLLSLQQFDRSKRQGQLGYAETAGNLALFYADQNQPAKALQQITESNQVITQLLGTENPQSIASLNKVAFVKLKQGQVAAARTDYEKALLFEQKSSGGAPENYSTTLGGLAQCYQREGKYRIADSLYTIALQQPINSTHHVTLLGTYASLLQELGQLNDARSTMIKASAEIRRTDPQAFDLLSMTLENIAALDLRLGDQSDCKIKLDSALSFYTTDQQKQSTRYASLLLSVGRYHQALGEYVQAEPLIKQATDILKKKVGDQHVDYANALNIMGLLYQTLGNYAEAEPMFKSALSIQEKVGGKMNSAYASVLQNLASLYQLEEKYDLAEPLLVEAVAIDKTVSGIHHPQYGTSLQNLATLYQKRKQFGKASELMETVRDITQKSLGKHHPSYATVVSNLASLYQDEKQFDQAEKFWKESVELRKHLLSEDHPDYARSLYGLAGVYFATGKLDQAGSYFTQVINLYQKQIDNYFSALSEKEKSAFYARIKPVFESYQDFCVQQAIRNKNASMVEALFDNQLATKAILLNASNKVRTTIQNSNDNELKELYRQWLQSKEALVKYYGYSREERENLGIDIKAQEDASNDLEKKLSGLSSLFNKQVSRKNVGWKEVQTALKENEAAIEIIRIRKKYVTDSVYYAALIVSAAQPEPQLLLWPYGKSLEERKFRFQRNAIKYHLQDTVSYGYFWKPLADALKGAQNLYISSDGVFNKINFNTLQAPGTKRYVLEDYTIHFVSNTRELTEQRNVVSGALSASIFGHVDFNLDQLNTASAGRKRTSPSRYGFKGEDIPMLPSTEKEVNLLHSVLAEKQWKVDALTLSNATEEALKKINSPGLLHIATHGFFLSDVDINDQLQSDDTQNAYLQNPLFRSGILLAGAGTRALAGSEDGVLTAYEAMNLNLDQTELVALSACETGLGEVRNGEGVYGLQRSFLVAGARTVLMSLWQVDDEATQELMSSFYKVWLSGTELSEAFRQAELEIKNKYKEPYYWGAFVLIGK